MALLVNLVTNPSAEVDTADWVAGDAFSVIGRSASGAHKGSWAFTCTCSSGPNITRLQRSSFIPLDRTKAYAFRAHVASSAPSGRTVTVQILQYDAAAFIGSYTPQPIPTTALVDLASGGIDLAGVIPANGPGWLAEATRFKVQLFTDTDTPTNHVLYADAISVVELDAGETTAPAYFDGDSPGCIWSGTRHASTSTRRLTEGQALIRTLTLGRGTDYKLIDFNPFNRAARADQGDKRAWSHGAWSGVEWMDQAVVPMRILVRGTGAAGWLAAHQQLAKAFAPVGETTADVELRFLLAGVEYLLRGRPRMIEPAAQMLGSGQVYTQAAFVAPDPLIYDGIETVHGPSGLPTVLGGLQVPITTPFTIDVTYASGVFTVVNAGTVDTGLILRIDGPVTEPRIILERAGDTAQVLRVDVAIQGGEWLDIDTAKRTVLLNGTSNRRGQASGEFPLLPPGTHTLRWAHGADFNSTAKITARFRSAWW